MTKSNQWLSVLFVAVLAVAGAWQFAGAQGEKVIVTVKWEYTSLIESDSTVSRMNLLGKDGWELVGIEPAKGPTGAAVFYFKRGK
jgi:hypothetical protein